MQWPLVTRKMFVCDTSFVCVCMFCRACCFDVFVFATLQYSFSRNWNTHGKVNMPVSQGVLHRALRPWKCGLTLASFGECA